MIDLSSIFQGFNLNGSGACFVSGGIDSMVLLELLSRHFARKKSTTTILHFNFHLREKESDRDEFFVKTEAERKGFQSLFFSCPLEKGGGIQNKARQVRREAAIKLAQEKGWKWVMTAHQANDQAETVLMNLMRGAGLRGLRGMEPGSFLSPDLRLIRPLLEIPRSLIEQFALEQKIPFVEDSTNATDNYYRNRIRHHFLPLVLKEVPSFLENISVLTRVLAEENRIYEALGQSLLQKTEGGIALKDYFLLPEPARFFVIEKGLKKGGVKKQVLSSHFEEIECLLGKKNDQRRMFGECLFEKRKNDFIFSSPKNFDAAWQFFLQGPGSYTIAPLKRTLIIQEKRFIKGEGLFINPQKIHFPLIVRFPRPGDRFSPFGMEGTKKLSDYFIDQKIPRFERNSLPVVVQQSESGKEDIICLVGHQIDQKFRVMDCARPAWTIRLM